MRMLNKNTHQYQTSYLCNPNNKLNPTVSLKSILAIYTSRVHIYDIAYTDKISSGHSTTILAILKMAGKRIRKSLS